MGGGECLFFKYIYIMIVIVKYLDYLGDKIIIFN